MLWSNNVIKQDGEQRNRTFAANLRVTHKWFDRWVAAGWAVGYGLDLGWMDA